MVSRPQFDPVTDADLQGFVDGRLAPERHMEIDAFLARTPDARDRVETYREINRSLHGLYSGTPLPEARDAIVSLEQQLSDALTKRHKFRWAMSVAAAMLLSVGIGTLTSYMTRPGPVEHDDIARFTGLAANAHHIYANNDDGTVKINAINDRGAVLFQTMSHYLSGLPNQAPDLTDHGFKLVGGQMSPGAVRPSLHFVYQNDKMKFISLHAGYADRKNAVDPIFTSIGSTPAFYWRRGGVAFTLIGDLPKVELLALTQTISRAEVPSATPEKPRIEQATAPAVETPAAVPIIEKAVVPGVETPPIQETTPAIPEVEAVPQEEPKET